jgi:ABC-type multidrug transport system ATPase subunit
MDPNASPVLQAQNLTFVYPGRTLFDSWSGGILPGVSVVLGGDGVGKTSLLRLFAGALSAQAGELRIGEIVLKARPEAYRAQLFWTEARSDEFDELTPPQYFALQHQRYPDFDDTLLLALLEGLGLEPHLHKQLFMLSTGSKRKVWLAAAFASRATLILIDEPFAALDGPSIAFVTRLLQSAAQERARAVVIADYSAPAGVEISGRIDLGD